MTLQITPIKREFSYGSMTLADPGPSMTPEEVKTFYSASFGELTNAEVQDDGTTDDGSVARYSFVRVVGTKG